MAKEINEKTFELNITSELLNLSKSFLWYINHSPLGHLLPRNTWREFINQSVIFSEGLTQEQETDPINGGYDVSINYTLPNGLEGRLMFLQYKAGIAKSYSNKAISNFYRPTAELDKRTPRHILFTFNDAAKGTQHSTLRNLARNSEIQSQSVMYVFPRITERTDFRSKIGSLIYHSSFVPVVDLDKQAQNQTPSIFINDGVTHKFRTSYDGSTSEVNFFFFFYNYDALVTSEIISEFISIQIERTANLLKRQNITFLEAFLEAISDIIEQFISNELELYPSNGVIVERVNTYIQNIKNNTKGKEIPQAPSRYTTIIPKDGLKLKYSNNNDFSTINYQLF